MGAATCCRGGGGAVRQHGGRGEGCHLLRTATVMMVSRLTNAAMMGIPTFLKVSREVRDLRRGVTSVRGRGRACSQYSEVNPCQGPQLPHPLAPGVEPRKTLGTVLVDAGVISAD